MGEDASSNIFNVDSSLIVPLVPWFNYWSTTIFGQFEISQAIPLIKNYRFNCTKI